jgi:organic hydroperoxide reductase OsmC/OhrA
VSEPNPEGEEPYEIPGTQPALEPSTLPEQPLTAAKASCFVAKEIG